MITGFCRPIWILWQVSLVTIVLWINGKKGVSNVGISLDIPKPWKAVLKELGVEIPVREVRQWCVEVTQDEYEKMGMRVSRSHHKKMTGIMPVFEYTTKVSEFRVRVARLRIQYRLRERQLQFVLSKTGMSRLEFWYTVYVLRMQVFEFLFRTRNMTGEDLAVLGKVTNTLSASQPMQRMFRVSYWHALTAHLIVIERAQCCWASMGVEELQKKGPILATALATLGDMIATHQLHCKKVRQAYYSFKGNRLLGGWKRVVERVGNPFGRKDCLAFVKMPKSFSRCVYTIEQLQELTELIGKGVSKKFVVECVKDYGIFLPPTDYVELSRILSCEVLQPHSLQKVAWLHHMNVPVGDMLLCAGLMLYAKTFVQARELAHHGVVPELLVSLRAALLPEFTTQQTVHIHERCEQEGMEKVLMLLKERRQQAVQTSSTPSPTPSPVGRKRRVADSRVNIAIPPVEVEEPRSAQVRAVKDRAPASYFFSKKRGQIVRGLKRSGWQEIRTRGPHHVFRKGGFGDIALPLKHRQFSGGVNPYTLASAFAMAGLGKKETMLILNT